MMLFHENDLYLEKEYIGKLAPYLEGFKKTKNEVYNFRCPICGDSSSNKTKQRGYIVYNNKTGSYHYFCHNCGLSVPFPKFLKSVDTSLYNEYNKELYFKSQKHKEEEEKDIINGVFSFSKSMGTFESFKIYIKPVSELSEIHQGRLYLQSRGVPADKLSRVYYTDALEQIAHHPFFEGKYKDTKCSNGSGILYKLTDANGIFVGFQFRSIDKNTPKHKRFMTFTQRFQNGYYGFEYLEGKSPEYIVEGCTDSLFLPNAVAVLTSKLGRLDFPDAVYFSDNEPRNKEIVNQINGNIGKDRKVVLCMEPKFENYDVNDLYSYFGNYSQFIDYIKQQTFQGLAARMVFAKWRKV